jgi:sulfite oxidase
MPIQSAILLPEPGSVIDGAAAAAAGGVWFKGYAWGGSGQLITRVDLSSDGGATWEQADISERLMDTGDLPDSGRAWSWVKWQLPLQVGAPGNTSRIQIQIQDPLACMHHTWQVWEP